MNGTAIQSRPWCSAAAVPGRRDRGTSGCRPPPGRLPGPFSILLAGIALFLAVTGSASAQGIAAQHPGDQGIETDSKVIFVEMFEEATVAALIQRWEDYSGSGIFSFNGDIPAGSAGARSLLMTHVGGQGTGGYLYRRLLPGYSKLYLRYYVKFDPACRPIRHFPWLGGYNPSTSWPQGGAGTRPTGTDRFSSGVETSESAWRWDFYTYWMEMRSSGGSYWGNDFVNDSSYTVPKGEWICVEFMLQMNTPTTSRGGEQALWINGQPRYAGNQLVSHLGPGFPNGNWVGDSFYPSSTGTPFEGFRWRSTDALNINFVWLEFYITDSPTGVTSRVWFDHVVVATDYIGPIAQATVINPVQGFTADPIMANAVTLRWTNPPDAVFAGTMIRYSTAGFPQSATAGTLVCDRSAAPGSQGSFEHLGVTPNTRLYYAAFAHTADGRYATPVNLQVDTKPYRPENLRVIDH